MEGWSPGSRRLLTDVGRKRDFVDGGVQVDDVGRSFVGVEMRRQPLRDKRGRSEPDRKWLSFSGSDGQRLGRVPILHCSLVSARFSRG